MTDGAGPTRDADLELSGHARILAIRFLQQAQEQMRRSSSLLPPSLVDAFLNVPRERFLKRYVLTLGGEIVSPQTDPGAWLQMIYSDANLGYVSDAGERLPSTATSPLAVLQALSLLDVQPGQTVVEVGAGGGFVLGLIGHMVGPQGSAIGLEIVPELVEQSRAALADLGLTQAQALLADGGAPPALPMLDRVMFNSGLWSLPDWVFEKTRPGARVMVPVQTPGSGDDIAVLVREPRGFRAKHVFSGSFIDSSESLSGRAAATAPQDEVLRRGAELGEVFRLVTPFGMSGPGLASALFGLRTSALQSYLAKTDDSLFLVRNAEPGDGGPRLALDQNVCGLGLTRRNGGSLAVLMGGALVGYGDASAAHAFLKAYRTWTEMMMPGVEAFDLYVTQPGQEPPEPFQWREHRATMTSHWRPASHWPRLPDLLAQTRSRGTPPRGRAGGERRADRPTERAPRRGRAGRSLAVVRSRDCVGREGDRQRPGVAVLQRAGHL